MHGSVARRRIARIVPGDRIKQKTENPPYGGCTSGSDRSRHRDLRDFESARNDSRRGKQVHQSGADELAVNAKILLRLQTRWPAIVALLWCGCAFALSPDLTIRELRHTAWGPGQGAPLGGAVALVQTNDGYLWIASPSGLFRFDGTAFERGERPNDSLLPSVE